MPQFLIFLVDSIVLQDIPLKSGFGWGVFEKHKTASPKAIPIIFTHKLFRRAKNKKTN